MHQLLAPHDIPELTTFKAFVSSNLAGLYFGEDVKYQGTGEGGAVLFSPEIVIAEDRGEPS